MKINNPISEHEPNDFGTDFSPLPDKPKGAVKSLKPATLPEISR